MSVLKIFKFYWQRIIHSIQDNSSKTFVWLECSLMQLKISMRLEMLIRCFTWSTTINFTYRPILLAAQCWKLYQGDHGWSWTIYCWTQLSSFMLVENLRETKIRMRIHPQSRSQLNVTLTLMLVRFTTNVQVTRIRNFFEGCWFWGKRGERDLKAT